MSHHLIGEDIHCRIVGYLSESSVSQGYICGAYVGTRAGYLVVEHDEGWSLVSSAEHGTRLLDYTSDQRFEGVAGMAAVLDWLS